MKKSRDVPATLIIAIAASLGTGGCSTNPRDCVDANGRRLPDIECRQGTGGARWIARPGTTTGGFGGSGGFFGGS